MTKLLCGYVLIFIATEQQQRSKYKYNWKTGNIHVHWHILLINGKF